MIRAQGRDLHAEFVRLLPARPQPISIQRWSLRRVGLLALVALLLLLVVGSTSSSILDNEVAVKTPLNVDRLDCGQLEPLLVMAQSVPSATMLPCLRTMVPGWTVAKVAVNDGRSVVTLNHDRAGEEAAVVRLTATCDTGTAGEAPSDVAEVQRYERVDRLGGVFEATWYDRFPGGCVTYRLRSGSDPTGQFAVEARVLLGLTSRQELARRLEQRSAGRLHLDPGVAS
jgi:hypothetical protein